MEVPPIRDVAATHEQHPQSIESEQDVSIGPMISSLSNPLGPVINQVSTMEADGADSGIDVVNETPHRRPSASYELNGMHPAQSSRTRKLHHLSNSPIYHSDPNCLRWNSPGYGRHSSDLRVGDRQSRLATACARQRMRNEKLSSLVEDGTFRMPGKLVTWHVAMESRPPLRVDMSGPTPTTYSPRNKPLYETNAPAYSFGRKDAEIRGSGQRAWAKLWFRSHSPFTFKTNYELNWPSPPLYKQKSTFGPKQVSRPEFPSHSIGIRSDVQIAPSSREDLPASNLYTPELAKRQVMKKAPAYSMGCKFRYDNWVKSLNVPAPNFYNPKPSVRIVKPSHPAYTMCVERRFKRHDVGPFATL